ncbi:integrase core domain-containing protein [Variovorax paradoxus]|uniref:integrase core domain-containing protein n=1 Tax=Variovorax paradoxus TaxID=34073 RepID=UPI003F51AAA7
MGVAPLVQHILIERRRLMQNGCIVSFNGKLNDERLDEQRFETPQHVKTTTAWRSDYNEI